MTEEIKTETVFSSYTEAQKRATEKYRQENREKINEQRKKYYQTRKENDPEFLKYKREKAREYYLKKKGLKPSEDKENNGLEVNQTLDGEEIKNTPSDDAIPVCETIVQEATENIDESINVDLQSLSITPIDTVSTPCPEEPAILYSEKVQTKPERVIGILKKNNKRIRKESLPVVNLDEKEFKEMELVIKEVPVDSTIIISPSIHCVQKSKKKNFKK